MTFDYSKYPGKRQERECILEYVEPYISIITPYYNSKEFFKETYNSVMNQSFINFEWIIVDDKSSRSEDLDYLKTFSGRDSRIKIFYKEENEGASSALNYGIRQMKSEIFVPLNADDLIEPEFLEIMYTLMTMNPNVDCCYTNSVGFGEEEYLWSKDLNADTMKIRNEMTSCMACKKSKLLDIGMYDEDERIHYEDWEVWLKLIAANVIFLKIESYLFWYRRKKESALSMVEEKMMDRIKILSKKVDNKVDLILPYSNIKPEIVLKNIKWRDAITSALRKNQLIICSTNNWDNIIKYCSIAKSQDSDSGIIIIFTSMPYFIAELQQKIRNKGIENYVLPSFLDESEYLCFIEYLIKFKKVGQIYLWGLYANLVQDVLKHKYKEVSIFNEQNLETAEQNKDYHIKNVLYWLEDVKEKKEFFRNLNYKIQQLQNWSENLESDKRYFLNRINEIENWNIQLEKGKEYLENQNILKDQRIAELEDWSIQVEKGKRYLETQNIEKSQRITELEDWIHELEAGKEWILQQLNEKQGLISQLENESQLRIEEAEKLKIENSRLQYKLSKLLQDKWIRKIVKLKKYDI